MVDLILLATVLGTFYDGFRCGNAFDTLGALLASIRARVGAWFH